MDFQGLSPLLYEALDCHLVIFKLVIASGYREQPSSHWNSHQTIFTIGVGHSCVGIV